MLTELNDSKVNSREPGAALDSGKECRDQNCIKSIVCQSAELGINVRSSNDREAVQRSAMLLTTMVIVRSVYHS